LFKHGLRIQKRGKEHMKKIAKVGISTLTGAAALTTSLPALAHSEHASIMSGIVHFMTEPDHLAISGLVSLALIFIVRRMGKKKV
jgi:hydrogenase/urease accessory protein HupE